MQEYLYAVAYAAPRSEKVVTVGLATALIRGDIFFWGSLMAGALVRHRLERGPLIMLRS